MIMMMRRCQNECRKCSLTLVWSMKRASKSERQCYWCQNDEICTTPKIRTLNAPNPEHIDPNVYQRSLMYICCIYLIYIYKHKNQITSKSQTKLQERECDCPRKKLEAGEQVSDQEQRLRHQAAVAEPKIGQKPLVESALPLGRREE